MAHLSVDIKFANQLDQGLVRVNDTIDHGAWGTRPPDKAAPQSTFDFSAHSIGAGVEGSVNFRVDGTSDIVYVFFDNPYVSSTPFSGNNKYDESAPPQYIIEHSSGGDGNHASITFTLKPLPKIHAALVRTLSVHIKTSNEYGAGTANDVYFDIGGLGWELLTNGDNDFNGGHTYVRSLDLPFPLTPADVVWLRLAKKGVFGVTGSWDGIDGAWKPESLTVIVNQGDVDQEELTFNINRILDEGRPSWLRALRPDYTLAEAFAHTLRFGPNIAISGLSELLAAGTTLLFKDTGVSGWDPTSFPDSTATGVVIRTPAWSDDGFATIDLKLTNLRVGATDFMLDGFHGVDHTRYLRIELLDFLYLAHTIGDKQRVQISGSVKWDTDSEGWYEIHPRDEDAVIRAAPEVFATHSGPLVQSRFGTNGNFELVVPVPAGGVAHSFRNNDLPGKPWIRAPSFAADVGAVDATALIASNFGDPGALVALLRTGDRLLISTSASGGTWPEPMPLMAGGGFATGVTGTPGFIQGRYGWQGNYEIISPLVGGGLVHYSCDNDDKEQPWTANRIVGDTSLTSVQFDAVGLIQSRFGFPGHFEVIARAGDSLFFLWRDELGWHGPRALEADGTLVTGAVGTPSLVQTSFGNTGDFELAIASQQGGIDRYCRYNDLPDSPWRKGLSIGPFSKGFVTDVSLIQSTLGDPGEREIMAHIQGISIVGVPTNEWDILSCAAPAFAWTEPRLVMSLLS
jgi:PLAT/LH2 domain